jgi:hypothetical protein
VSKAPTESLSKDQLVLAMLAALGGDRREVNERDLFLACWHAFPNAMRWADTALPNPDTFTASLRRLDADEVITRLGKQARAKSRKRSRPVAFDAGRSGVVKARVKEDGLEKAGLTAEHIEAVRRLAPAPETYRGIASSALVTICIGAREAEGRITDEGALVETAFHKFPAMFAYRYRPEFPDVEVVRAAVSEAREQGLLGAGLTLTDMGRHEVGKHLGRIDVRPDSSESYSTGAFRLAERIETTTAYKEYREDGSLAATKGDELFRALRLPPTTDTRRIAAALRARIKELQRIDKGDIVTYLLKVAREHNPEVLPLLEDILTAGSSVEGQGSNT